ncbi:hypothetical protein AX16_010098 [Volvariella volvacea WC 439]|nr:hypothetical protein AX16_010098 [Volvariella volvacea WC 439]
MPSLIVITASYVMYIIIYRIPGVRAVLDQSSTLSKFLVVALRKRVDQLTGIQAVLNPHYQMAMQDHISRSQVARIKKIADMHEFWYHALPEEGVLTLDDLHQIVQETWLTRFDEDLEAQKNSEAKGSTEKYKGNKHEVEGGRGVSHRSR